MGMTSRTPVLVGIGLASRREDDPRQALEPIALMIEAARAAGRDAGGPAALAAIGRILVPKGRWSYGDPGREIARAIGATGAVSVLSTVGVLQQSLLGDACRRIAGGEIDAALVVGGDAGHRILRSRVTGIEASSSALHGEPDVVLAPHDELRHPAEMRVGLKMPVGLYAIIASAFRAERGWSIAEHGRRMAELYSGFTRIAAENPGAWSRTPLEPDAIRLPSDRNPMQAFPYTKRHCSSWNVDQAAALLLLSEERAVALGLDRERWVYPWASTESNHMVPVAARAALHRCPGAGIAGEAALDRSALEMADVDFLELYSCFPVAVECTAAELGIAPERDLTVTGGMPFAGGPYNNYVFQATCRMAEVLRQGRGRVGLVSSVSGIMTKQGFGLWSRDRPPEGFQFADVTGAVARASPELDVVDRYAGPARIAGYTVVHERSGSPRAIVVADVEGGRRAVAASDDPETVAQMGEEEFCGQIVQVEDATFRLPGATPFTTAAASATDGARP